MRRFFNIFFGLMVLSVVALGIYFVSEKQKETKVSELVINIQYAGPDVFLIRSDIELLIAQNMGDVFQKSLVELDIEKIESLIRNNPYVSMVNVFSNLSGRITIDLIQRQPIARIVTNKANFYIDSEGFVLPLDKDYVSRVVLVNGMLKNYSYTDLAGKNIRQMQGDDQLKQACHLANYIYNDEFLKALTEQIYLNKNKEFEIVPKIGKQLILLGEASELPEKFRKLELFYKQGITLGGWDRYKLINLKFENQVVCTKRI